MTTKERTAAARYEFTERTGIRPVRFRAMAGSMKEFAAIALDERGAVDFDREAVRTAGGWDIHGLRVTFKDDNDNCRRNDPREVRLNIKWSEFRCLA